MQQAQSAAPGPEPTTVTATAKPVLTVEDLQTHFFTTRGVVRAVDGVSFSLAQRETLAVVGESGSGKSVSGLSIMRLLKRTPGRIVGGRIMFVRRDGSEVDLARVPDSTLRSIRGSEIAMIFQDPMSSLNPVFSIGDQIAENIVLHHGRSYREAMRDAAALLADVGIPAPEQRLRDYPHQLSGGMRQRVMIAIALSCAPRLLIADEPTTALDVTIQEQIVELLARLQHERQIAVIFITHDLRLVGEIADRIAVMYCGQVVEEGAAAAVLAAPRHPYTLALLECLPKVRASGALRPIPGWPADPADPPVGCRFHPRCSFMVDDCIRAPIPLLEAAAGHRSRCIRHELLRAG